MSATAEKNEAKQEGQLVEEEFPFDLESFVSEQVQKALAAPLEEIASLSKRVRSRSASANRTEQVYKELQHEIDELKSQAKALDDAYQRVADILWAKWAPVANDYFAKGDFN